MISRYFILIIVSIVFYGCYKPHELSEVDRYFNKKLIDQKSAENFEEDSDFGYIKIGKLFNNDTKHALVVSFDSVTSLKIYQINNDEWEQIYRQENVDFARLFPFKAYVEDYNFDGIKDIGIKNEISNGTAIMTFHLWLSEGKSFKYIPEFETIGNPTIIEKTKTIQGFKACCKFSEITLSDYHWENNKLVKVCQLDISNYPYGVGIEANSDNLKERSKKKLKLTENNISELINKHSQYWKLK